MSSVTWQMQKGGQSRGWLSSLVMRLDSVQKQGVYTMSCPFWVCVFSSLCFYFIFKPTGEYLGHHPRIFFFPTAWKDVHWCLNESDSACLIVFRQILVTQHLLHRPCSMLPVAVPQPAQRHEPSHPQHSALLRSHFTSIFSTRSPWVWFCRLPAFTSVELH